MSSMATDSSLDSSLVTELLPPMEHSSSGSTDTSTKPSKLRKHSPLIICTLISLAIFFTTYRLLTFDKAVCTVTIFATMTSMAVFNLPSDLAMFSSSVFLLATQVVDRDDFLNGFGNSSVVCVGLLLVVAKGVEETGALERLVKLFLGKPGSKTMAQLAMMIPVLLISAFLSNTACVAMMIPIIQVRKRGSLSESTLPPYPSPSPLTPPNESPLTPPNPNPPPPVLV